MTPKPIRGPAFIAFLMLGVGTGGCAPTTPAVVAPVALTNVGAVPTEAECGAFAKELEKAVASGNVAAFDRLYDWDALLDQTTSDIAVPAEFKRGFIQGFKESYHTSGGFFTQLAEAVKAGGEFKFLRDHRSGSDQRVLFRVLAANSGVNYHDYVLVRRADGKIRAVDCYIFLSGEKLSETLRRIYLVVATSANRSALEKLVGKENEFVQAFPQFKAMLETIQAGKAAEAIALFDKLPAGVRTTKVAQLAHIQATQAMNDDKLYLAAIDEFRKTFPDDACVDLISIDGYFLRKEYDKAGQALERVDKALGGDAYLGVLRATCSILVGNFDQALAIAKGAVKAEPTLRSAYDIGLTASLKAKHFDDTLQLLKELEKQFHLTNDTVESDPDYADFVKSPQYKELRRAKGGS